MSDKLNINQWAEEDRPREKMASLGAEALSSAELLAILIGSGSTKESAVDLMKRIITALAQPKPSPYLPLANLASAGRWNRLKNDLTLVLQQGFTTICIL